MYGLHRVGSRDRGDDFAGSHDRICVIREINVKSGMHHLVRVISRRILDHCDFVAELGGVANGRFDAGMRDQPDDDELVDAVLLEL